MSLIEKLKHIDRHDVDFERIYLGLYRRLKAIPDNIAWNTDVQLAKESKEKIRAIKDIHKGERCFIIGNGPSLNKMDLAPLRDEFTFGLNRIYLLFPRVDFQPTYYATMDKNVSMQFHQEIGELSMPKFISWSHRKYYRDIDNCIFIPVLYNPHFSTDLIKGFWSGASVTFMAMQVAYHMGFEEVILIGVDHRFKETGVSGKPIKSTGDDVNHFAPNYFSDGTVWLLPNFSQNEWAYSMAKELFETQNRKIMDATLDGNLDVFPKVEYDKLF